MDAVSQIPLNEMPVLNSFAEIDEVLRSPAFAQGMHQGRISHAFLGDTLLALNGERHFERRRMENALFRRDLRATYELDVFRPLLLSRIDALLDNPEHVARIDLMIFVRTLLQAITAKMIGFDIADNGALERLREFAEVLSEAGTVEWSTDDHDAIIRRGLMAKNEFVEEFYKPARDRRLSLLRDVHAGLVPESALPSDLITMLLQHHQSHGLDEEVVIKETLLYMIASSGTITQTCAHTFWQMFEWFETHPADLALNQDGEFLRRLTNETLRLYSPTVFLVRRAVADSTLSTGRLVKKGEYLYMDLEVANRDPLIFGDHSNDFDPHRTLRDRSRPFGLSFGGGAHMCIGRSLASGGLYGATDDTEPSGVIALVLAELLAVNVALDQANAPQLREKTVRHEFATFPVVIRRRVMQEASSA